MYQGNFVANRIQNELLFHTLYSFLHVEQFPVNYPFFLEIELQRIQIYSINLQIRIKEFYSIIREGIVTRPLLCLSIRRESKRKQYQKICSFSISVTFCTFTAFTDIGGWSNVAFVAEYLHRQQIWKKKKVSQESLPWNLRARVKTLIKLALSFPCVLCSLHSAILLPSRSLKYASAVLAALTYVWYPSVHPFFRYKSSEPASSRAQDRATYEKI